MSRAFGSRSSASSSLTMRALRRVHHMSGDPLGGVARGEHEEDEAHPRHDGDSGQEHRPDVAGEEHGLQARDEVARRTIRVSHWIGPGMELISKRKPDRRNAGKKPDMSASCE